jgi:hypothetical protein
MPTLVNTSINVGSVALGDEALRDELLTFAGAATVLAGTILARDSVSLKMVPFVKGGSTNQNGTPKGVVTYDVVAAGAGDVPCRVVEFGKVNKQRLIINADGTGVNVDTAVLDQLRAFGITPQDVLQTSS